MSDFGGEDEMTVAQRGYIDHLLETRNVSSLFASRLIAELFQLPERNASGLEQLDERLDRETT